MKYSLSKLSLFCAAVASATLWQITPASAADAFGAGDAFVVAQQGARLMRGWNTLTTLSQGQRLTVLQTEGDWVGTSTVVNGRTIGGWVHKRQIVTPEQFAQRRTTRRSYSYQPGMRAGASPNSGRGYSRSSSNGRLIMGLTPYGPSYWRADRKILGY